MIVKASNELRRTIMGVFPKDPVMVPIAGKTEVRPDLPELLPLIPDWLRAMVEDGNVMIMDPEEYHGLPVEIQAELEVYTR